MILVEFPVMISERSDCIREIKTPNPKARIAFVLIPIKLRTIKWAIGLVLSSRSGSLTLGQGGDPHNQAPPNPLFSIIFPVI
jgi:hypothetical protein